MRPANIDLETPSSPPLAAGQSWEAPLPSARLLATEEDERRRVSRELHDDLGQRLALLEIQIEEMARRLQSNREACAKGLGLTSVAERVRLAGGVCVIRSAPGRGTRIQAWVPLAQPQDQPLLARAG